MIAPTQRDAESGVAVAAFSVLFALWLMASLATNRLSVTAAGVAYQNFLRRKVLSWAEIQSFSVGPSRGMIRWPSLVISRKDGTLLVASLASYTRTYPTRVAHELTAWQQKLAPFAPSQAAP